MTSAQSERLIDLARSKWAGISPGAEERLVLPGSASFACQPLSCEAMCCRSPYLAGASVWDVERLEASGYETSYFIDLAGLDEDAATELLHDRETLKTETRRSTALRLRHDEDERCVFLQPDQRCGSYEARPNGCVQYPFQIAFAHLQGDALAVSVRDTEALDLAVRVAAGQVDGAAPFVPLLLRDSACPGFDGPPLDRSAYGELLLSIWELAACYSRNEACDRHPHAGVAASR